MGGDRTVRRAQACWGHWKGPGRACRWRTEAPRGQWLAQPCTVKTTPHVQTPLQPLSQPLLPFYSALEP